VSGAIVGVNSRTITLSFNTAGLEVGAYSAFLIINSNDPVNFEKIIPVHLRVEQNTAVDEEGSLPVSFALSQNLPNPFHTSTRIEYHLPKPSEAELQIFNLQGQLVRTLVSGKQPVGRGSAVWNGLDQRGKLVASGVYFFVLKTPAQNFTRKLVFAR